MSVRRGGDEGWRGSVLEGGKDTWLLESGGGDGSCVHYDYHKRESTRVVIESPTTRGDVMIGAYFSVFLGAWICERGRSATAGTLSLSYRPVKQLKNPSSLSNTTCCTSLSTSPFVVALITLTLDQHPVGESTTSASIGNRSVPHHSTSPPGADSSGRALTRVNTNLNSSELLHLPPPPSRVVDTGPKLTFTDTPGGKMGREGEERRAVVNSVVRLAYTRAAREVSQFGWVSRVV